MQTPAPAVIHVTARGGTAERSVKWNEGSPQGYGSQEWKRLSGLARLVQQILGARPEIKALPLAPMRM